MSQSEFFEMSDKMFLREGAFILDCERASEALQRRVRQAHTSVKTFTLGRDELGSIATKYAHLAALCHAYHLAEADRRTKAKRGAA